MKRTSALAAIVLAGSLIGCATDDDELSFDETLGQTDAELATAAYTPFSGASSTGSAATYPWQGYNTSYPAGDEDFRGYALPLEVECSSTKSRRSHLDVTAGCLTAVAVGSYSRGEITSTSDGAFRVVALPFKSGEPYPLKWTDVKNEYRFYYKTTTGPGVDPGFKAFVRYRDENDLYVASWRTDGVVQIKRKQNGTYKTLAETTMARPSTSTWHTLRFDATGARLDLYLDGAKVLSATDTAFAWGTAGIRTDAMTGAYIDEWTVR